MKANYTATIFLFMLIMTIQDDIECENKGSSSQADCSAIPTDSHPLTRCCLVQFKQFNIIHNHCYVIGNTAENIKNYIKYQLADMDDIKVLCSSIYIKSILPAIISALISIII